MSTFAECILKETDFIKKIEIMSFLKKKNKIYFNNSVIMKVEILREFIDVMKINVDKNLVVTAGLIYDCLKIESPEEINKIKKMDDNYRDFLGYLGFSNRFINICIGHSRQYKIEKREMESDLLEIIDQFGAMLLHRSDRLAYSVDEALDLLINKNLVGIENLYLSDFKKFVEIMEDMKVMNLGLITRFQKDMNCLKRDDIPGAVRELYNAFERNEKCFAKKEAELRMGGDLLGELKSAQRKIKTFEDAPFLPGLFEDDI